MNNEQLTLLEKAFLFYSSISKVRTNHSVYPYFMRDFNCAKIRDALINEKFLKLGTAEECLRVYPHRELQNFLKSKEIALGNKRDIAIKHIIENSLTEELADNIGYLCYIPTEIARQYIENYTINDFYRANLHSDLRELSIEKYNLYTKHDKKVAVSIFRTDEICFGLLRKNDDESKLCQYNALGSEYDVCLYIDKQFVAEFKQINYIYFLLHTHIIIFEGKDNSSCIYQPFDFLNIKKINVYRGAWGLCNVLENNDSLYKKYRSKHTIFEKGYINYYVSSDKFTKLIMKEIFTKLEKRILTEDIKTSIINENDDNYIIKVPDNDSEMCEFIMYLFRINYLHFPTIMNVPIHRIFSYLRYNMYIDIPIKQLFVREYNAEREYIGLVIRELKKFGIHTIDGFIRKATKIYPCEIVYSGDYRYYTTLKGSYQQDIHYKKSIGKESKFEIIYNKCLFKLKELNLIPVRWKNEFMLYLSVLKLHKDAIYQYRDKWLGLQSLDIFIPSIDIGIEYQGIQHYEAVDYFGGEENYKIRVELDLKKRQLCEENGIILLEWPYTKIITDESVAQFLLTAKQKTT